MSTDEREFIDRVNSIINDKVIAILRPLAAVTAQRYINDIFNQPVDDPDWDAVENVLTCLDRGDYIGILDEMIDGLWHSICRTDKDLPPNHRSISGLWEPLRDALVAETRGAAALAATIRSDPRHQERQRDGIEQQWVDTKVDPPRVLTFDEVAALGLDGTLRT